MINASKAKRLEMFLVFKLVEMMDIFPLQRDGVRRTKEAPAAEAGERLRKIHPRKRNSKEGKTDPAAAAGTRP